MDYFISYAEECAGMEDVESPSFAVFSDIATFLFTYQIKLENTHDE